MLGVFSTTGVIFLLMALGYVATLKGLFSASDLRVFGRYMVNFALPALIFHAVSGRELGEILDFGYLAAYLTGSLAAFWLGYGISRKAFGLPPLTATFQGMGMSCSNSGFVGYPILLMTLPSLAPTVLALNMTVENLVMIPTVLILAERAQGTGLRGWRLAGVIFGRLLRNPIVLALILGLFVSMARIPLPALVTKPIDLIASSSAAISLLMIGGTLVGLPLRAVDRRVLSVVFGKLLFFPLAVWAGLLLFGALGLAPGNDALALAAILSAAVPAASIYPILAQRFGEEERAALAMLLMTGLSFLTLSVTMAILDLGATAAS